MTTHRHTRTAHRWNLDATRATRFLMVWAVLALVGVLSCAPKRVNLGDQPAMGTSVSALATWDDGLCEMSYYKASDVVYGKRRRYTRTVLVNRQWMDRESGVKTTDDAADALAVFKINIVEEIPTENYNYRYQTTAFLTRGKLAPFKMVVSSQEWCGTTFKHLRWYDDGLVVACFSYLPDEGDRTWHVKTEATPYEALLLVARDVAATGESRSLDLLPSMRSNRFVEPEPTPARIEPGEQRGVRVPAGTFIAQRVDVVWSGPATHFLVETTPPYRLLMYQMGAQRGELAFVERRSYWDSQAKSGFYKPGKAP